MDDAELADRADENLWESFKTLARVLPLGAVREDDGVLITSWGAPISFFNPVFVLRGDVDPAAVLGAADSFFSPIGLPYLVRVREDIAGGLPRAAKDAGLAEAGVSPGMALHPVPADVPGPPEGLELRAVEDEHALEDHWQMLAAGFGAPLEMMRQLFPPAVLGTPCVPFVGYLGGEPVCSSLLLVTGRTAGVYNVATVERFRRRGFGEAATWHAILEGLAVGCDHAILQASEMGRPIYERMGFRLVSPYLQFEGHPKG